MTQEQVNERHAVRLTVEQKRVVVWMRDGDRALTQAFGDPMRYGYFEGGKFKRVCSRKTLEAIIRAGVAEWYHCSPPDLRAMLVLPKSDRKRSP